MPADRWELILVDNGSRDDTPEVIREFQASAGFRVISVREPRRGSGRAKNAALVRATGGLCVFTDDDCYVGQDFLREMLRAFETDDIGYLGGRVLLHDPKDAALTIQKALEPQLIEPRSFVPMGLIHGANMAALRTTLDAVGGFDPLFGGGRPSRATTSTSSRARRGLASRGSTTRARWSGITTGAAGCRRPGTVEAIRSGPRRLLHEMHAVEWGGPCPLRQALVLGRPEPSARRRRRGQRARDRRRRPVSLEPGPKAALDASAVGLIVAGLPSDEWPSTGRACPSAPAAV